jgi:putative spermidine/putrescine transport system permease protein
MSVSVTGGRSSASLRQRLAERGLDRTTALVLPAAIFVAALFAYPLIYGLDLSFSPLRGGGALANYRRFFSDSYLAKTILITFKLGLPAAVVSVLASVPIALRLRGQRRGGRTITTLLVIPITLGTVLTADGLLEFLGPHGWFNKVLTGLHITHAPLGLIHNYWGVLASLIVTGFPFAYLLTSSYLSGIDRTLESAASTLGAGAWQRFRLVTLPLLAPGLAINFCLSFVLAFSVFPSAQLIGDPTGSTHVISVAAYNAAFQQYDYPMGSAIAMVMAAIMLVVVGAVLLLRSRLYTGPTGGKG